MTEGLSYAWRLRVGLLIVAKDGILELNVIEVRLVKVFSERFEDASWIGCHEWWGVRELCSKRRSLFERATGNSKTEKSFLIFPIRLKNGIQTNLT